jgi:glycosyltransferase involved in cell wall biosynthesis
MDGRSYVIGSMLAALTPLDPAPVVWTLSNADQVKHFRRWFEEETELSLSLTLRPGPGSPRRGYYLRTLASHTWGRVHSRAFDLIVTTDSAAWCDPSKTLLYICFPVEGAPDHDLAQAGAGRRAAGRAVSALHRLASPRRWSAPVLAVSDYTARFVREMPRYRDVPVTVAAPPPPGVLNGPKIGRPQREIVSIGALMEDKGLEAMVPAVAAAKVATWRVIGNRADPLVESRLVAQARSLGVPLALLPDADTATKRASLDAATVLLHPKPTEHLGIAILEGVARGCLPLIAATAGLAGRMPRECVFADPEEAAIRLRALLDLSPESREALNTEIRVRLAPLLDRSCFDRTVYSTAERILASPVSAS